MQQFSLKQKGRFVAALLRWFAAAMRPLPWRKTYTPYGVWISEIMLQQTQMERGVRYFNAWMERFPDIRSVADADASAILAAWEGLGYYSRAGNLHAAAKRIMERHNGEFPQSLEAIRALPGVGEYTAGAIASIAFNLPVPAVDANVMRIFARLCDIDSPLTDKAVKTFVAETAASLIPADSPRLFNQALMELGALVCGKAPLCGACPVREFCEAHRRGTVSIRPGRKSAPRPTALEMVAAVVMRRGHILIRQRPPGGLWGGLWELPGGEVRPDETPAEAMRRHLGEMLGREPDAAQCQKLAVIRHGYTTFRVTLHGYLHTLPEDAPAPPATWVSPVAITDHAFPAGHRKLFERLGWKRPS